MPEISTVQPKLHTQRLPTPLPLTNEERIIDLLTKIYNSQKHITNYHVHYFITTSNTKRYKIDILRDTGVSASELIILDNGGGFQIEINDENYKIASSVGFQLSDEKIDNVYITGSGTAGTAEIRFGMWRL